MLIQLLFTLFIFNFVKLQNNDLNYEFPNESENIFSQTTTQILTNNYTKIYENLLEKISKYCITNKEYEDFYKIKLKPGLISTFFPFLIEVTVKQIGLNELRHCLNLKKQKINFVDKVNEEVEEGEPIKYNNSKLEYFKKKVYRFSEDLVAELKFWPEDIQNANKFLDKKFPVRQLFQLKCEEMGIKNFKILNKKLIDDMFEDLKKMERTIYFKFFDLNLKSSSANFFIPTLNCSDPKYFERLGLEKEF
uniref:Uncharacterized protein n=1 Tax=Meloidogyne enterolobii TaxID=390850 RepID=A0A6V7TX65_MELEN|nr:unnamed protein product [Meloidogyne enterolobii]